MFSRPNTSQDHDKEISSDDDILSFDGSHEAYENIQTASQDHATLRSSDDDIVSFEGSENESQDPETFGNSDADCVSLQGSENGVDLQNEPNDDNPRPLNPDNVGNSDNDLDPIEGNENEFDIEYENINVNLQNESQDDEGAKSTDECDDPEYLPSNSKTRKKPAAKKRRKRGQRNFGRKTNTAKKMQSQR